MIPRAGFFRALLGSCCGRDIFYILRTHSWGRTLFHLFLLSLITGVIISHVRFERVSGWITAAEEVFTEVFGKEICVTDKVGTWNWVCPVKDPLTPRKIALPQGGMLYYTGNSSVVPDSLKSVTGTLIVWSPVKMGIAVPAGKGTSNCMTVDTASGKLTQFTGSNASLEKIFKENPDQLPRSVKEMKKESVDTFFMAVASLAGFCMAVGTVLWNFFITLLYTGIFIGMYRLLNGASGRLRFLTLKEMWKCGIYAAFPAMVIASFFPVLELPFVSYETVFMIGLLIYWMAVTAKLERTPDNEVNNAN